MTTGNLEYGIQPQQHVNAAYCWRYGTTDDAMSAAKTLSAENNVDVIVFKIIGEYARKTEWNPSVSK